MAALNTDDAPVIKLGGTSFPVPLLAAKQNRLIDPLILALIPIFTTWQKDRDKALLQLTQDKYDALLDICYVAITRAQPDFKKHQLLDLPVNLPELIAAFPIIAAQTGVFKKEKEEEKTTGEAAAGNSLTGTES